MMESRRAVAAIPSEMSMSFREPTRAILLSVGARILTMLMEMTDLMRLFKSPSWIDSKMDSKDDAESSAML